MDAGDWSDRTDFSVVCHRAGGRRAYNAKRRFCAAYRRMRLAKLLNKYPPLQRGIQSRLAAELGVSRSTVCRDMQRLLREWRRRHELTPPPAGRGSNSQTTPEVE
jgi:hypothetical protein